MATMVDPTDGMVSFQQALISGLVHPQPGELDPNLYVLLDNPTGNEPRFTYVRLDGKTVTAFVVVALAEPVEGLPCFQIGVAVPENFRRQGRAREAMLAAIHEMRNGFGRAGVPEFYIEAVVHKDNRPSQRVAEEVISRDPIGGKDGHSGEPILQYLRKVQTKASN